MSSASCLEGHAAGGIAVFGAFAVAAYADVACRAFLAVLVVNAVLDLAVDTVYLVAIHNNTIPF